MTNPQISAETIEALRRIDSATVANAIEHFEVRDPVSGYASLELRCQFPEAEPMVGFAVTATQDTTSAGDDRPNRLHDVLDMVAAAPKPVVLAVQYTGGDRMRSCLAGDMFCSALQKLGGVGIVTDLGSRDFQGIAQRAPGFQLFCAGAVVSHGYGAYTNTGTTISIFGLTVSRATCCTGTPTVSFRSRSRSPTRLSSRRNACWRWSGPTSISLPARSTVTRG